MGDHPQNLNIFKCLIEKLYCEGMMKKVVRFVFKVSVD